MSIANATRRAERLATLHKELSGLIKRTTEERQSDLFAPQRQEPRTREALASPRTVTLSLRQTCDLFRAALPPTARDVVTRRNHALLMISLRYFLDSLHTERGNKTSPASLAAGLFLGRELRTWLRRAERATLPVPTKQTAPDLRQRPLNIITIIAQKPAQLHNAVPVRSRAARAKSHHSIEIIESSNAQFKKTGTE